MLKQLLTIAQNTFTEAVRQPIFAVLVLVGSLGLLLNVGLAAYSMAPGEGDNQELVLLGLSMLLLSGTLLAGATAPTVLSEEIDQKTVLTVVSKPVARPVFVLGKYLGVAGAITLAYVVLCLVFLLTMRQGVFQNASNQWDGPVLLFGLGGGLLAVLFAAGANYLYRRVFTSTVVWSLAMALLTGYALVLIFDKGFVLQSPLHEFIEHDGKLMEVLTGLGMLGVALWVLTAVAVLVSTRLGPMDTILICVGVFFAGLFTNGMSGWVNQQLSLPPDVDVFTSMLAIVGADLGVGTKGVYLLAKLVYLLLPNLQFFWPADAITSGNSMLRGSGGELLIWPVGSVLVYGLLYVLVLLSLAVALFQRREVG
jgi:ABC-type transport system involved in multi-copper enzyme maturation permease subunit